MKTIPKQNLTNIHDQSYAIWVEHDPRSVRAMLLGHGDGREKLYEKFVAFHRKRNPKVNTAYLHIHYPAYASHMARSFWEDRNKPRRLAAITEKVKLLVKKVRDDLPLVKAGLRAVPISDMVMIVFGCVVLWVGRHFS